MVCHHPHPSHVQQDADFKERMRTVLAECTLLYHPVVIGTSFQFPERRLIQYDCGVFSQCLKLCITVLLLLWQRLQVVSYSP